MNSIPWHPWPRFYVQLVGGTAAFGTLGSCLAGETGETVGVVAGVIVAVYLVFIREPAPTP